MNIPIFHKHAMCGVNLGVGETRVMERARLTQFVEFMQALFVAFQVHKSISWLVRCEDLE